MPEVLPLRLGPLGGDIPIRRSAIRWRFRDGQDFRQGDLLGYCGLSLGTPPQDRDAGQGDFYDLAVDRWDLQASVVAEQPGRFRRLANDRGGGWHDIQPVMSWEPEMPVAGIEPLGDPSLPLVRLHFTAGRRACEIAEDRSGLLTGWHDRSRGWRGGDGGAWGTLLGLGTCELHPIMLGDSGAFLELLEAAGGSTHIVEVPDRPLVHTARTVVEQMRRTEADRAAIATAFAQAIAENPATMAPGDWAFVGASVQALNRSPASESYDLLGETGITTVGPADAVILSINAEGAHRPMHRELGFTFDCHGYRVSRFSPGLLDWYRRHFTFEVHGIDEIRRDYLELVRLMREVHPQRQILVLNAVTQVAGEDTVYYDAFDAPLSQYLRTARAREINGMLHDIAREPNVAIVDVDAMAAELGGGTSIPDGIHQNGPLQAEIRSEILSILRGRGVPGFGKSPLSVPA